MTSTLRIEIDASLTEEWTEKYKHPQDGAIIIELDKDGVWFFNGLLETTLSPAVYQMTVNSYTFYRCSPSITVPNLQDKVIEQSIVLTSPELKVIDIPRKVRISLMFESGDVSLLGVVTESEEGKFKLVNQTLSDEGGPSYDNE